MRRTVLLGLIITATACAPAPLAVIREASTTPPPPAIPDDVEPTSPEDAGAGDADEPATATVAVTVGTPSTFRPAVMVTFEALTADSAASTPLISSRSVWLGSSAG